MEWKIVVGIGWREREGDLDRFSSLILDLSHSCVLDGVGGNVEMCGCVSLVAAHKVSNVTQRSASGRDGNKSFAERGNLPAV